LPAGLALDPVSGTIAGTPTTVGNSAFTVIATDTRGCAGSAFYTLGVSAPPLVNNVAVGSVAACLSPANPCVSVPFPFTRGNATPLRAMSVTVLLDAKLRLCAPATPASNVHLGSWGATFTNRAVLVNDLGGGRYAVDIPLLGTPCGETGGGTLFALDVAAVGPGGRGTISVTSVLARDCANAPVAVVAGTASTVGIVTANLGVTPATLPGGTEGAAYNQT